VLTLLAHCGANWIYCDGGTGLVAVMLLWGTVWAGRKADRKAKQKRAQRDFVYQQAQAHGVMDTVNAIAAQMRAAEPGAAPARTGTTRKQGTTKKKSR
jgi:hypothetical protein